MSSSFSQTAQKSMKWCMKSSVSPSNALLEGVYLSECAVLESVRCFQSSAALLCVSVWRRMLLYGVTGLAYAPHRLCHSGFCCSGSLLVFPACPGLSSGRPSAPAFSQCDADFGLFAVVLLRDFIWLFTLMTVTIGIVEVTELRTATLTTLSICWTSIDAPIDDLKPCCHVYVCIFSFMLETSFCGDLEFVLSDWHSSH